MQQKSGAAPCRFRVSRKTLGLTLLVVPAALTVGSLGLPSMASATSSQPRVAAAAMTIAHPVSAARPAPEKPMDPAHSKPLDARLQAYFRAGYDYDDAVLLTRLWAKGTTVVDAKLRAGQKLLHGVSAPIKPGQTAWQVSKDVALQAYFANGYNYQDAKHLARVWTGTKNLNDIKATAGRKVLAGLPLPSSVPNRTTGAQLRAYSRAGYDYDDAVLLSRLWADGMKPADAKMRVGDKLLHGIPAPIKPGQTAWQVSKDVALQAYFANGYDYQDANQLARVWTGTKNLDDVKATAGRKVLAGLPLPLHR